MTPTLAVVIPTLNEEKFLPPTLECVRRQTEPFDEIVVCDGGSLDQTRSLAESFGARVLSTALGRGLQIAAGVEGSASDVVLVLHADAHCHPKTAAAIRDHFRRDPNGPGGCLGHRFDRRSLLLRLVEFMDRRRARAGDSYGDQGQFFRRTALDAVGGFPRLTVMEDVEFSRRLRQAGRPFYLDLPVTSSARGFERLGVVRTALRNWRLRRAFAKGDEGKAAAIYDEYYAARSR